ncbi:MAG: tRNA uridine-5-carboxymethylaminomethyl(34) synthesis GTPase MnmE [Clostridia bacterium]|nr:tRNA uridine-5-carboxymethylaminomethyl(34) synthesis GTPase MnmE [Clostridia bacterium]
MSTIAAISTPFGSGGIAVIRISGHEAFCVADKFFVCQKAKRLFEVDANTVHYGKVYDKDKKIIDNAVVTVFKAPHSFTGEDTVEISCHGGILIAKKVLKSAIDHGAVLAQRGEFTKRAFLNGKMDLSQAEGVIDLINSVSDRGAEAAVFQLEGRLSEKINVMRNKLLNLAAHLQAYVDFPEEEIEELGTENISLLLSEIISECEKLIKSADYGKILKDGIPVAVIGKPNVGKSSLLNCLSGEEKAIVTNVAGTTRDIVEEYISIDGFAVKLMDTAGIRKTEDLVESIGVKKSVEAAKKASFVLAVFDGSKPFDNEDREILDFIKDKKALIVLNKSDLGSVNNINGIKMSAKSGEGFDELIEQMKEMISSGENKDGEVITNERHYECLVKCLKHLNEAFSAAKGGMMLDMIGIDIELSIEALGEIVGLTVSEEIVDKVFHNFCLGK